MCLRAAARGAKTVIKKYCDFCLKEIEKGKECMSLDEEIMFHICKTCIEKNGLDDA